MVSLRAVRGRTFVVLLSTLAVVAAGAAFVWLQGDDGGRNAGTSSARQSTGTPAPTPSPSLKDMPSKVPAKAPALDAREKAAATDAEANLRDFLSRSAAALTRNDGKANLASLAAGPALGEIQALATQYKVEEIKVSGSPKVLGARVLSADLDAKPATLTFAVCLDNSSVAPRDANGRNLAKNRSPAERVVLNLYQVQKLQDEWLVVNHSIPADSNCKRIGVSS